MNIFQKIYDEINLVIEDTKKMLTSAVGEHEISVINKTALYIVDWDYETMQKSFTEDYYEKNDKKIRVNQVFTRIFYLC